MSYVLRPAGATSVAFSSIHFDGVRATNIRAFLGSREVSFRTGEGSGLRLDGTVELPAMKAEGRLQLRLEYEVQPAWSADGPDLVLPLLVAHWPPDEARSGTFRADVVLPAGSFIYSAFPTGFVRTEAIDLGSDGPSYRFVLPVVPALLRLRVGDGPPPLVTFESAVDAATIAVLVFFAVVGWRRIREHWT